VTVAVAVAATIVVTVAATIAAAVAATMAVAATVAATVTALVTAKCDYLGQVAADYASRKPSLVSMGPTNGTLLGHQKPQILLHIWSGWSATERAANKIFYMKKLLLFLGSWVCGILKYRHPWNSLTPILGVAARRAGGVWLSSTFLDTPILRHAYSTWVYFGLWLWVIFVYIQYFHWLLISLWSGFFSQYNSIYRNLSVLYK
jgi:hypothetical protein